MLATFTPTPQQDAVDRALALTQDNLLVLARAGTGKTTSMCWWIDRLLQREPAARVLAVAFNRIIADELTARLPKQVMARTFHSLAMRACAQAVGAQTSDGKMAAIIDHFADQMLPDPVKRTQILKELRPLINLVYATRVDPDDPAAVEQLAADYDKDLEHPSTTLPLLANVIRTARNMVKAVSYDCMVDHVLVHNYRLPQFDYIFVDEAQDLNRAFLEMIGRMCGPQTRLIAIGDDRQAIYAFRGADHRSIDTIRKSFRCKDFPLSVTFRCGKSIVERARSIVPDYEAGPDNPEGSVEELPEDECQDTILQAPADTLVLCRNNAPLLRWCMVCLRHRKQAYIRGRDIGKELVTMLTNADRGHGLEDALAHLASWARKKAARLRQQDNDRGAEALMDKVEALETIAEQHSTVRQAVNQLERTYRDKGAGVVFSTVHKAKGLEADTVILLGPEQMPPRWIYRYREDDPDRFERLQHEELNIKYVAITRTKNRLLLQELPRD